MAGTGAEYPIARITIDYLGVRQAVDESKRALGELVTAARQAGDGVRAGSQSLGELSGESGVASAALAGLRGRLDEVSAGMGGAGKAATDELAGGLEDSGVAAIALRGAVGEATEGVESGVESATGSIAEMGGGMAATGAAAATMGDTVGESMGTVAAGMSDAGRAAGTDLTAGVTAAAAAEDALTASGESTVGSVAELGAVASALGQSGNASLEMVAAGMANTGTAAQGMRASTEGSMDAVAAGMSRAGREASGELAGGMDAAAVAATAMGYETTGATEAMASGMGAAAGGLDVVAAGMSRAGYEAATATAGTAELGVASVAAAGGASGLGESLLGSVAKFASVDAAIHGIIDTFHDWISAIGDAEQAEARLNAMIKATGDASGVTAQQVKTMAEAAEGRTLFKSEEIEQATAALMTFRQVHGEVFKRAEVDMLDLGQQMGSVEAGARSLGFALENPTIGMARLRRAGITFTDAEMERIKALEKSGDLEAAQVAVLAAVEHGLKDVAEAAHTGVVGGLHDVSVAWKNMLDSHKDDGIVTSGIYLLTEAMKGLSAVKPEDVPRLQLGGMADDIDAIAHHQELAGRTSFAHPQDHLEEMLAYEQHTKAVNGGQDTDPDQEHRIQILTQALALEQQLAVAANAEYAANQRAAEAGDKAAEKDREAAAAARARAEAEKRAKEEAKNFKEGMEDVQQLAAENMALRENTTDLHAAAAAKEYYLVLGKTGDTQLAETARHLTLENEAIQANIRAQEEANRKKAEASERVEEYINRLHEEADALAAGGKPEPSGHDEAVRAAGGNPDDLARIRFEEDRLTFYKTLETARQDDVKQETDASQQTEQLWDHTLTHIGDAFGETFQKALDGQFKSFEAFCKSILLSFAKTMDQMSADMLHTKLSPDDKEHGGKAKTVLGAAIDAAFHHTPTELTEKQYKNLDDVVAESRVKVEEAIPASEGGFAKPTPEEAADVADVAKQRLGTTAPQVEPVLHSVIGPEALAQDQNRFLSQDDVVHGRTTHHLSTLEDESEEYFQRGTPRERALPGASPPAPAPPAASVASTAAAQGHPELAAPVVAPPVGSPSAQAEPAVSYGPGGTLTVPYAARAAMAGPGGGPHLGAGTASAEDVASLAAAERAAPPAESPAPDAVPQRSESDTTAAVSATQLAGAAAPGPNTASQSMVPYAAMLGMVAPSTEPGAPVPAPTAARDAAVASAAANALAGSTGSTGSTPSPGSPLAAGVDGSADSPAVARILDEARRREQNQGDGGQQTAAGAAFGAPASAAGSSMSLTSAAASEAIKPPEPYQPKPSPIAGIISFITPFLQKAAGMMGGGVPSVPQQSDADTTAAVSQTTLGGPPAPGPDLSQVAAENVPLPDNSAPLAAYGADASGAAADAGSAAGAAAGAGAAAADVGATAATAASAGASIADLSAIVPFFHEGGVAGESGGRGGWAPLHVFADAPKFHDGGLVGEHSAMSSHVPHSVFSSAPRYHTGLGADEFPAILKKGERVLTERHQQAVVAAARDGDTGADGGMGGDGMHTHVHFDIKAIDHRDAERFIRENQHHIAKMTVDTINRNRSFSRQTSAR